MLSIAQIEVHIDSSVAHRNQLLAVRHDNRSAGLSRYHPVLRVVSNLTVTTWSGTRLFSRKSVQKLAHEYNEICAKSPEADFAGQP